MILRRAAGVFGEKGFHRASIRDISAATGVSLSGLYYYFKSKDELLFLIQKHCFEVILERLERDIEGIDDPEERLRILVRNHLRFFTENMEEMKVLSHEADALSGPYRDEVLALKRAYNGVTTSALRALVPEGEGVDLRVATFSLFGMMNWIYTWYRPGKDVSVDRLADDMLHILFSGLERPIGERTPARRGAPASIWKDA